MRLPQTLSRDLQNLQAQVWNEPVPAQWRRYARDILRARRELLHLERRSAGVAVDVAVQTP